MADDAQLLRHFVETRSERAFRDLVERHVGLVYHAAVRQLGPHRHLADDVAQSVFVLLAEKSAQLLEHPSLAGWLHASTRFKVGHALRAERRRQIHEDAAAAMNELARQTSAEDWERIRPVLDEALFELNERDREALLLRFFENRPVAEVAARLKLTEAAAYKCVERALDRLQRRLVRRGITSSVSALAILIESHAASAVPAGLAGSVMTTVVASGLPAAMGAGLALMTAKTTLGLAAAAAMLTIGVATYDARTSRQLVRVEHATEADIRDLEARLGAERQRIAREQNANRNRVTAAAGQGAAASPPPLSYTEEKVREGRAFLKAHPEVEAAILANYRTSLRYQYAELIAALGLSEDEVDRLVAVLIRGRTRAVGEHLFRLTDEPMSPGQYTRELKSVLGDEGYEAYRAFERSWPAKGVTNELIRSLYYTNTPLSPGQIVQFRQLVNEVLNDGSLGPRYTSVWTNMPMPLWDAIVQRAASVLSAPQLEPLADLRTQGAFWMAQSEVLRAYHQKK